MYLRECKGAKTGITRKCLQLKWGWVGERVMNYGGTEGPSVQGHIVYYISFSMQG